MRRLTRDERLILQEAARIKAKRAQLFEETFGQLNRELNSLRREINRKREMLLLNLNLSPKRKEELRTQISDLMKQAEEIRIKIRDLEFGDLEFRNLITQMI